jgi:hypothetical protein
MGVEIGEFAFDLPQQLVVRCGVARIGGDRLAQSGEETLQIADMIIDLGREHAGFTDRLRNCGRLIAPPSDPDTSPDQDGEWNDGGDHQGPKPRSNAAQHRRSPHKRNLFADPTAIALRGRAYP